MNENDLAVLPKSDHSRRSRFDILRFVRESRIVGSPVANLARLGLIRIAARLH